MKRITAILLSLLFLAGTGMAIADTTPKAPKTHHTGKKHHKKKKDDKGTSTSAPAPAPAK